jgi:hypothetical protein
VTITISPASLYAQLVSEPRIWRRARKFQRSPRGKVTVIFRTRPFQSAKTCAHDFSPFFFPCLVLFLYPGLIADGERQRERTGGLFMSETQSRSRVSTAAINRRIIVAKSFSGLDLEPGNRSDCCGRLLPQRELRLSCWTVMRAVLY